MKKVTMKGATSPQIESAAWLLVAHNVLHLENVKPGAVTWWCIPRTADEGDTCFIYRPLIGIALYFEIVSWTQSPQGFCSGYGMDTAEVKILKVFKPPITAKELKRSAEIRNARFVKRNFQWKEFHIEKSTSEAILQLVQSRNST